MLEPHGAYLIDSVQWDGGRACDAGYDIAAAGTRLPVAPWAEVFPAKITHKGLSECPQGAGDPVAGNP